MAAFEQICQEHFPGAVPEADFVHASLETLAPHGFTPDNAIACVGVCRDELCHSLIERVVSAWGEAFNFASLAGMLLLGKTGFSAAHIHSPLVGGRERYVYFCMPHIGIGPDGEIGVATRLGRPDLSTSCGALCCVHETLSIGNLPQQFDADDPELSLLYKRLSRRIKPGAWPSLIELTEVTYQVILEDLEHMIEKTVDPRRADFAVITGVQVHAPSAGPGPRNHVWPRTAYAVVSGTRVDLDLMKPVG